MFGHVMPFVHVYVTYSTVRILNKRTCLKMIFLIKLFGKCRPYQTSPKAQSDVDLHLFAQASAWQRLRFVF